MTESRVPAAYLVHALPGRIRLRVPEKRGDAAYFSRLAQALSQSLVGAVAVNASTGSVLVHDAAGLKPTDLAASGRELALFEVHDDPGPRPARSALVTASAGLHGLDGLFARASGGHLDFRSGMFIVLLLLAGRQIYKGNFMVPGFTFLWHALNLMME